MIKTQEYFLRQFMEVIVGHRKADRLDQEQWDWIVSEAESVLRWLGPDVAELQERAKTFEVPAGDPGFVEDDGHNEDDQAAVASRDRRMGRQTGREATPIPMRVGDKEIVSRMLRSEREAAQITDKSSDYINPDWMFRELEEEIDSEP